MKKKLLFCLALIIATPAHSHKLSNTMLKTIDQAGFFNRAIIDVIKVRQKVKELLHGKLNWHGAQITLQTTANTTLQSLVKRPETLFGATFIVVNAHFAQLSNFVTKDQQNAVQQYLETIQNQSVYSRYEHAELQGVFTGSYAIHPITKQQLPIYIADYTLDLFDTRHNFAHIGIPAHIAKDFEFAQKHLLPIKQVVTAHNQIAKHQHPVVNNNKQLVEAYTNDADSLTIINSDFLNGTSKAASAKAIAYLVEHNCGKEYKTLITYPLNNHEYSLEQIKTIEDNLFKEHLTLSTDQAESLKMLMNYAFSDLFDIVEPFLKDVRATKDIMVELVQESCKLHSHNDSYLLQLHKIKDNESERVIFKQDMTTFTKLTRFCSDLVDFLGDFASSCPVALENLKNLKNNK